MTKITWLNLNITPTFLNIEVYKEFCLPELKVVIAKYIRPKNLDIFFNYGQGGSIPRLFLAKIYQFYMWNQYFIEFSLGIEPPLP